MTSHYTPPHTDPTIPPGCTSVHFYQEWASCRKRWWFMYRMPSPHGDGVGITPHGVASPLLVGGAFHHALESYYSHDRDVERAVGSVRAYMAERRHEWEDLDEHAGDVERVVEMLRRYHDRYGPGGPADETGRTEILRDKDGKLYLERALVVDLGEGVLLYSRVDAAVRDHGFVYVRESKTTAGAVGSVAQGYQLRAQTAVEKLAGQACIEEEVHGVQLDVTRSVASKGKDTPNFLRQSVDRSPEDLAEIARTIVQYQREIDVAVAVDDVGAFTPDGQFNGRCHAWGRACEYASLCLGVEHQAAALGGFKTRVRTPTPTEAP